MAAEGATAAGGGGSGFGSGGGPSRYRRMQMEYNRAKAIRAGWRVGTGPGGTGADRPPSPDSSTSSSYQPPEGFTCIDDDPEGLEMLPLSTTLYPIYPPAFSPSPLDPTRPGRVREGGWTPGDARTAAAPGSSAVAGQLQAGAIAVDKLATGSHPAPPEGPRRGRRRGKRRRGDKARCRRLPGLGHLLRAPLSNEMASTLSSRFGPARWSTYISVTGGGGGFQATSNKDQWCN